ncbi:MAG: CheR family methyltransferase [Bacteroidota bacterium]
MTGFFHVPSAFGVLEEKVIPALFNNRSSQEPIRVWVAGCATGEEAYSVAILLFEFASTLEETPTIEIYATDNDQAALDTAQEGIYPGSIVDEMSSVCLGKYFVPHGNGFSIIPEVKAAVHFSSHDVLIDNSFQSFELITCRHLLAYLDQASQSQIVTFFHHSLRPGGFLFLGDAEFAESLPEQFESVDNIFKIYRLSGEAEAFHIDLVKEEPPEEEDDTLPTLSERQSIDELTRNKAGDGMVLPTDAEPSAIEPAESVARELVQEAEEGFALENGTVEASPVEEQTMESLEIDVPAPEELEEPLTLNVDTLLPTDLDIPPLSLDDLPPENGEVTAADVSEIVDAISNDSELFEVMDVDPVAQNPGAPSQATQNPIAQNPATQAPLHESEANSAPAIDIEDVDAQEPALTSIQVDPPFDQGQTHDIPAPVSMPGDIISQLHRSVMLQDHAPASLLIDRAFKILDHTGRIDRIFDIQKNDLTKDYLDKLPDFYRLKLEETLNQIFHEKNKAAAPTVSLPGLPGKKDVLLEIQLMSSPDPSLEIVHVLFKELKIAKKQAEGLDDTTSFFASPAVPKTPTNGVFGAVAANGTFEENFIRSIKTSPFPVLLHVEGGHIIELSQPWVELSGVTKEEAPTISAWTRKVKGQRLKLKDSKLKESYKERGVVCVSIRSKVGDTKLLAFHSSYLGADSKGRKLTLTMAVDITNYPGHSGLGVTPEVADFGVAAKKAFLANMSHEIRTPLTSMIGFADYLSDKLTGQDVQFARYISESGNRLLETLNAVLRVSSMDGIEQVMRYEMLDITVEAQGVLQLFKPYAEQYSIPLKLVVEQPAKAKLDRASFRRVLSNLLGNAIKFTPEGEVTITVNSDVNSVIVEIEDTGTGITEEFLPFIFDRFSQESKGQGRAHSGCGLGLAICKNLVETMGGTIQVETEAGVGSKFTVKLPKEPNPRTQTTQAITEGTTDSDEQGDRHQILIVEDNTDTQELMLLILRDKYEVTLTANASETLQVIANRTFDAILMDLNLGGRRTGFELIRELRKVNTYESVPVLAVSALPIGVIRKQLIREGFNGYIAKPFTRARILDALEGVLNLTQ